MGCGVQASAGDIPGRRQGETRGESRGLSCWWWWWCCSRVGACCGVCVCLSAWPRTGRVSTWPRSKGWLGRRVYRGHAAPALLLPPIPLPCSPRRGGRTCGEPLFEKRSSVHGSSGRREDGRVPVHVIGSCFGEWGVTRVGLARMGRMGVVCGGGEGCVWCVRWLRRLGRATMQEEDKGDLAREKGSDEKGERRGRCKK